LRPVIALKPLKALFGGNFQSVQIPRLLHFNNPIPYFLSKAVTKGMSWISGYKQTLFRKEGNSGCCSTGRLPYTAFAAEQYEITIEDISYCHVILGAPKSLTPRYLV
jgi:hypothetical protein